MEEIKIAAKAGYDGVEIWMNKLQDHVKKGGKTRDVKTLASDLGIKIEDAICFAQWIVDDPAVRKKGFDQAQREMEMLAEVGCPRMAAPPAGATEVPPIDLLAAAERYAKLLAIGDEMGVVPQLELWGFSTNLHRVGQVLFVASEAAHPKACILNDVYHLYKGGSSYESLQLLDPSGIHIIHMNDYPSLPGREKIDDSYRIFPGDGVAPLTGILKLLHKKNTPIALSLELFNKDYWKADALQVAKKGLEKMKLSVKKALG